MSNKQVFLSSIKAKAHILHLHGWQNESKREVASSPILDMLPNRLEKAIMILTRNFVICTIFCFLFFFKFNHKSKQNGWSFASQTIKVGTCSVKMGKSHLL